MYVSDRLAEWCGDPAARRQSRGRAAGIAERFEKGQAIRDFRRSIAGNKADDVEAIASALYRLFTTPGWVDGLVADMAREALRDPLMTPPFRSVDGPFHSALLLVDEPEVAVSLGIIDARRLRARKRRNGGRGSINFSGRRKILHFARARGLELGIWVTAGDGERCSKLETKAITDGDIIGFDTSKRSYIFERAAANVVFLQGEIRIGVREISREFDAQSGRLVSLSSGEDAHSRAQLLMSYLRETGRNDAAPVFAAYAANGPHFVRWHAMREWLALDPVAARPHLDAMAANDRHQEVRAAAAKALALFEA